MLPLYINMLPNAKGSMAIKQEDIMESYEYVFTALRGRQAGREYYVAMCPMKLVPKIFLFLEEEIPAELRSQRTLNKSRIPEIANYIINNQTNYIFSSITASVDGEVRFEQISLNGEKIEDVGKLRITMDSRFIINDGQHRRAAIEQALAECPELGDETISVVFFIDVGLKNTQQMFADLNKHSVRPTRSIGILYDHRDPLSALARTLIEKVGVFRNLTEIEKTNISNRSTKLFTLSSIFQGTVSLLRKSQNSKEVSKKDVSLAIGFWENVCSNMKDWQLAAEKSVSTHELRQDYIHSHALAMHAIGRLGASLLSTANKDYKKELKKLRKIDWARKNKALWEGRAMIAGKISKSHNSVILTTNHLKNTFRLKLTPEEKKVEQEYLAKA
jgi:DNA sulfur modification protein DndB|tara:strand:- start:1718 stop:2881 length:1164 start_codon:yes stop_codon:yes gene_type:complete